MDSNTKGLIVMIIVAVLLFWIGKELFELIYYSNMPTWLKYFLLK
jgi:hypothetical protein